MGGTDVTVFGDAGNDTLAVAGTASEVNASSMIRSNCWGDFANVSRASPRIVGARGVQLDR